MISALINGKIEIEEDKITSSIFDNILQLPDEMIWEIIKKSCYDDSPWNKNGSLPLSAGTLLSYEYWPRWNSKNTNNVFS